MIDLKLHTLRAHLRGELDRIGYWLRADYLQGLSSREAMRLRRLRAQIEIALGREPTEAVAEEPEAEAVPQEEPTP